MSDLNRKQFEEWFDESGFYKFKETAWAAWEASRECLVIELPKHRVSECGSPGMVPDDDGDFFYCDEVISSIHAAGVKTK